MVLSCCKDKCESDGGHVFEIPVTLSPARDTFNIGDTITVTSIFPDELRDTRRDMNFKLKDFKFFPKTEIVRIDTVGSIVAFGNNFEVLLDSVYDYYIFEYSDGGDGLIGEYNYSNNTYSLSYQFTTKKSGLYMFEQFYANLLPKQDFVGKCEGMESVVKSDLNDKVDNNIDMLSSSPDPFYSELWISDVDRFNRAGGYCFYVRE